MKLHSFNDLFLTLLSEIYYVENKIVTEIPKFITKAHAEELKTALRDHLNETKVQVRRLEKIFKEQNLQPLKLEWINSFTAISNRADKFLSENQASPLLDAAIVTMIQQIEHFEIALYGTLVEFADLVENKEVKSLLKESLKEECKADELLTKVARGGLFSKGVNLEAQHQL